MNIRNLENRREVCWDLTLADRNENIRLEIHRPVRKNVALDCGADWELFGTGYMGVMERDGIFRLYYRARSANFLKTYQNRFCLAESTDGKTFTRRMLGIHDYNGSTENNIYLQESRMVDNFSVFYDDNPDCPPGEKYKALSSLITYLPDGVKTDLLWYRSEDGIHFENMGILDVPGVFDSYNVVLWDDTEKEYKLYVRDFHDKNGTRRVKPPTEENLPEYFRDVRLSLSRDFVHWTEPEMIRFADGDRDLQLYTGMIFKYKRAGNQFLGLPTRYNNRTEPKVNYRYLPDWDGERARKTAEGSRLGTVFCDTGIMTSRDGFHFERWNGAYMTPGLQRPDNWVYDDCFMAYGMTVTDSDYEPGTPEISLYRPEGYYVSHSRIVRYTVRLDGFFSWHADYSGGSLLTVPLTFTGNALDINFAASALGGIRIRLCDEAGIPLDGYDSDVLFGDMVSRNVDFEKPLSDLCGKPVRIRFDMKDADLYSFRFFG